MTNQNQPLSPNSDSKALDFENVINDSFATYRKIALYAGLALLVFSFIFLIFASATLANFINPEQMNEKTIEGFQKLLLTKPYIWYYTGFMILIGCVLSPFLAGFYRMADAAEKNTSFGIRSLFSCYSFPYVGSILVATFLINVITNAISLGSDEAGLPLISIFFIVPINFLTLLTIPLIVLKNYGAIEAIKRSMTIVSQNPIVIFMLAVLGILATLLGLFAFCIGIFFTYPFFIAILYTIVNHSEPSKVD